MSRVRVFNPGHFYRRLTLGRAPLCIDIIGTERRAQVRSPSSISEQYEQGTETQLAASDEPEFVAQ